MPWIVRLTFLSFLVGAAIAAAVIVLSWPRRSSAPGRTLMAMMASICLWSVPAALTLVFPSPAANLLLSKISYLGIVGVPLHYLLFSLFITKPDLRLGVPGMVALGLPAAVVLAVVFTNEQHHLVWTSLRPDPELGVLVYGHGPAYYALYGYLASMALGASVLNIGYAWQQRAPYRTSAIALILAAILPLLTSAAYAAGMSPVEGVDLTPGAFGVAGLLLAVALTRYRMLELIPLARAVVFDQIADGIVVFDDAGRVVDANATARLLLGTDRVSLGVCPAAPIGEWLATTDGAVVSDGQRFLDVQVTPLSSGGRARGGTLLLVRDVTRQQIAEAALRGTQQTLRDRVQELEQALGHVRTLQGLLPICAYCKRVRTDEDYWQQIESYVATRSDLRFSHGICPDCFTKVAEEFDQKAPGPPASEG